jgi:hypothetical protein
MNREDNRPLSRSAEDLKHAAEDIQRGGYDMFDPNVKRFVLLLDPGTPLGDLTTALLPPVEFDPWYQAGLATVGSMVGSGRLDWPVDFRTRAAHQLELIRQIATGRIPLHQFCVSFMYPRHGGLDAMVGLFMERIVAPFHREWLKLAAPALEREEAAAAPTQSPVASAATNVFNLHGHNPRVTFGQDVSHNIVNVTTSGLFEELRRVTAAQVDSAAERARLLDRITALEESRDTPSFLERYLQFMGAIADHAAVFGPYLPALAQLVTGR